MFLIQISLNILFHEKIYQINSNFVEMLLLFFLLSYRIRSLPSKKSCSRYRISIFLKSLVVLRDVRRGCSVAKIQIAHDQPSCSVPAAICIFCAFRYLSKRVPHLAFRGQYYTLREHNRTGSAISHRSVHIATRDPGNSACSTTIFRQTRLCGVFPSPISFSLRTKVTRHTIISRPKFIALTMNFHVRFSAQRVPTNDDLARKIFLAMIFHVSSFLFRSDCRWNWMFKLYTVRERLFEQRSR